MKIYTRTGDKGQTSLFGGKRVSKSHIRVAAYGMLDELNSFLGFSAAQCMEHGKNLKEEIVWIENVQKDLFALGSWLASPEASERVIRGEAPFPGQRESRTKLDEARVKELENDIDGWEAGLEPMKSFILPGGSKAGASLHYARTLCRRAEREVVALKESGEAVPEIVLHYLNRLADALFVLARHVNHKQNMHETPWT